MHFQIVLFLCLFSCTFAKSIKNRIEVTPDFQIKAPVPKIQKIIVTKEDEEEQNKNAYYQFESEIEDKINGASQTRLEARDGVAVQGKYSYNDGFNKRTVIYEADENGYRIVGMLVEPLEGQQVNPSGLASVRTAAHGTELKYRIKSVPVIEREEDNEDDYENEEEIQDQNHTNVELRKNASLIRTAKGFEFRLNN